MGTDMEEVYKGCSSFTITSDPSYELTTDVLPNNLSYNLAKETCFGPSCNFQTVHPWPSGQESTTTKKPSSTTNPTTKPNSSKTNFLSAIIALLTLFLF